MPIASAFRLLARRPGNQKRFWGRVESSLCVEPRSASKVLRQAFSFPGLFGENDHRTGGIAIPLNSGFADRRLLTWLPRQFEKANSFREAASSKSFLIASRDARR